MSPLQSATITLLFLVVTFAGGFWLGRTDYATQCAVAFEQGEFGIGMSPFNEPILLCYPEPR